MGKLDTLKVAAFVLRDLKSDERVYKQEIVKSASKKLYEAKTGRPFIKYASDTWSGYIFGDSARKNGVGSYDEKNIFNKGLNMIGRAFGNKDSIAEYANSSYFKDNPDARDAYIKRKGSGWFANDAQTDLNTQQLRQRANAQRESYRNDMANAMATQDNAIVNDKERYIKNEMKNWETANANISETQDQLYNNSGLYGGPGGLGYNVGGPAGHRPLMATNKFGWTIGGGGMWGPGARGYGYGGRGYGYGGRGSVYARGGMGGYYGRGGYGGYGGYGAPGAGTYPGMGPVMGGRATYRPGGPGSVRTWGW